MSDKVEETEAIVKFGRVLTDQEKDDFDKLVTNHFLFRKGIAISIDFDEVET